jgi:hypothetical protein
MRAVDRKEHYQGMAAECLRMAQNTDNPTSKALLLEMAQTWVKLAEQARDSGIDVSPSNPEG